VMEFFGWEPFAVLEKSFLDFFGDIFLRFFI